MIREALEDYCRTFDLAATIPTAVTSRAMEEKRLFYEEVSPQTDPLKATLQKLRSLLGAGQYVTRQYICTHLTYSREKTPLRVCVSNLGDFPWGPLQARVSGSLFPL